MSDTGDGNIVEFPAASNAVLDAIAQHQDDEALLDRLAAMPTFLYKRSAERKDATDRLDVTLKDLDQEIVRRRKELDDDGAGKAVTLYEPEP